MGEINKLSQVITSLNRFRMSLYQVSAMETESLVPLSAQIEVVVEIIDINDHFPLFGQDSYTAYVKEDALPGTQVITVTVRRF